jgi:hypothetical protein
VPDVGTAASVERGGARFTISVDSNPLSMTTSSWIVTTLANTGSNTMHWLTDACEFHEGLLAVAAAEWTPGVTQLGAAAIFKADVLRRIQPPIWLVLTPESSLGVDGPPCPDIGIVRSLGPGEEIVERTLWDGEARGLFGGTFGVGPNSGVRLSARFASLGWHRGSEPEWSRDGLAVELIVDVFGGRDPAFLSPGQAIDVALGSPELVALLATEPAYETIILTADSDAATWEVGLEATDGRRVVVVVEGLNGFVLEVITER